VIVNQGGDVVLHHDIAWKVLFSGVLMLPMLANRIRHLDQPSTIFGSFQNIRRGEKLNGIGRRVAKRFDAYKVLVARWTGVSDEHRAQLFVQTMRGSDAG